MSEMQVQRAAANAAVVRFGDRPRPGAWRPWVLLFLPSITLLALSTAFAVFVVMRARGDTSALAPAMNGAVPYLLIANHGLLFLLMLWFLKLDGMSARQIGWPVPFPGAGPLAVELGVGVVAGALFYAVHQHVFGPAVSWLAGNAPSLRVASESNPLGQNLALALVVAVLLGGFVEEQLFRGYVLVRLTERLSLAVAIPSMLVGFSLLHFGLGWTGMLVATLTGALLTGLFVWRRSLVPVIVAHALVNTLVLTL